MKESLATSDSFTSFATAKKFLCPRHPAVGRMSRMSPPAHHRPTAGAPPAVRMSTAHRPPPTAGGRPAHRWRWAGGTPAMTSLTSVPQPGCEGGCEGGEGITCCKCFLHLRSPPIFGQTGCGGRTTDGDHLPYAGVPPPRNLLTTSTTSSFSGQFLPISSEVRRPTSELRSV